MLVPVEEKNRARRLKWLRILCFALVFALVWQGLTQLLEVKYRWDDCWPQRYEDYAAEPPNTVDVVFIGNSQIYGGVSPMALYNEAGITSYNMSGHFFYHTLITEQLKILCELNTPPKCVVFSPVSLVSLRSPDNDEIVSIYFNFIGSQSTLKRKLQVYNAMQSAPEGSVDPLPFLAPLLGFHNRWWKLSETDFKTRASYASAYQPFLKGQEILTKIRNMTDFAEGEPMEGSIELIETSKQGWLEFFDYCKERDIQPIALLQPRFDGVYNPQAVENIVSWLEEQEVPVLNYMDETSLQEMGWNWRRHFEDPMHLNFGGSLFLAQDLALQLQGLAELEDHRGEEGFESWDTDVTAFFDAYGEAITDELGESYAPWWEMEDLF